MDVFILAIVASFTGLEDKVIKIKNTLYQNKVKDIKLLDIMKRL